jgi:hypothetical protein
MNYTDAKNWHDFITGPANELLTSIKNKVSKIIPLDVKGGLITKQGDFKELDKERMAFIEELTNKKQKISQMRTDLQKVEYIAIEDGQIITTEDDKEKKKIIWSYNDIPKINVVDNAKTLNNVVMADTIINNKNDDPPPNTPIDILQKIKCIECSIKKLELNLRLTNEDGIKDDEFLTLLTEISGLCGNKNGDKECETNLQEFVDEAIIKRDMNSISGLIKMASFMCPILAFANKSLFSELAANGNDMMKVGVKEDTVDICSKIIGYITRSGNEAELSLDDIKGAIDFIGETHEMGVIEGIVSFVGVGGGGNKDIETQIAGSIRSVVRRTVSNTIDTVLKTATLYQKVICMVFITLLSTHIYLTLCSKDKNETEEIYSSYIDYAYNMTNESMKIGFGIETMQGGGKKASKSRRAANAKPRAKRAAKAVSKAIAKAVAAKPKPKPKPKPVANATKPTTKPANATTKAKPKAANATAPPKKKK